MMVCWGCSEDDYPVILEQVNVERLLTADTSKSWIPVAPLSDECKFLKRRTFSISGSGTTRVINYESDLFSPNCPDETPPGDNGDSEGEETDGETQGEEDAQSGTWAVTKLGDIYNLSIYHTDTTHFEIKQITAQTLDLMPKEDNELLRLKVLVVN